jgi:glycerol uptake facilitator-like aquaporin
MSKTPSRALVAEGIGSAFLLSAIVGSGIMAERLAGGNAAIALLANSLATGGGLAALILAFGPVSGAHFNPLVTLSAARQGAVPRAHVFPYIAVQVAGACIGVWLAHAMFGEPVLTASTHARAGGAQMLSECVATFGLLTVVGTTARQPHGVVAVAVAGYIVSAYWFTASTSFANPAVTIARSLTDTFAGIRPVDVPGFVAAQVAGAIAAMGLIRWLLRPTRSDAEVAGRSDIARDGERS